MNKPFQRDVLIRFHHCDPAGIVFYPQYFVLFNELVEDWFNHGLNVNFASFHIKAKLGIPTVRVECEFLAACKIGEILQLCLSVKRIGKSSLTLNIEGRGPGNELRVEATLIVVLTSLDTYRPTPLSRELLEKLKMFVV
jgi:4-hydroxybenzoyl-CoA thioesterase